MRYNLKKRIGKINIYLDIRRVETLSGLTSMVEFNHHLVFWDFDNTDKRTVYNNLKQVQQEYDLSDIYVYSDKEGSYRAICFKIVDFITLLRIITNTEGVDIGFIKHTARRGKAVLRLSTKEGRERNNLSFIVPNYYAKIPESLTYIVYDTYRKGVNS